MQTRSFCPASTEFMVQRVMEKGWPRDMVEPVVVSSLAKLEAVIICIPVEQATDRIVGQLRCGEA